MNPDHHDRASEQAAPTENHVLQATARSSSPNKPFLWHARVYWEDTDAGGVVYHANYLKFMERARTEWLRSLGFSQSAMRQTFDGVFVVRRCEVDYLASARLDDYLEVQTEIEKTGGSSMTLRQSIFKQEQASEWLLCRAQILIVWVDSQAWRPHKIPSVLREAMRGSCE